MKTYGVRKQDRCQYDTPMEWTWSKYPSSKVINENRVANKWKACEQARKGAERGRAKADVRQRLAEYYLHRDMDEIVSKLVETVESCKKAFSFISEVDAVKVVVDYVSYDLPLNAVSILHEAVDTAYPWLDFARDEKDHIQNHILANGYDYWQNIHEPYWSFGEGYEPLEILFSLSDRMEFEEMQEFYDAVGY